MKKKISNIQLLAIMVALLYFVRELEAVNAADCLPNTGRSGDKKWVILNIQTWETRTSNFHTSAPDLLSSNSYTVSKSANVSWIDGASVRFYGEELCVAVTKTIESDKSDGNVDRKSVCQKSCFGVGSGTRLDIYSGSGGRITSTNPPCCLWGRTKELRFKIPAPPTSPPPSYRCTECTGCETNIRTTTCLSGEKCYTLRLQKKKDGEVVTVKGCSHMLRYWGENLYCDYKCKNNVPLYQKYGDYHYSVCVSCCSGNNCNAKSAKTTSGASSHGQTLLVTLLVTTVHALVAGTSRYFI